MHLIQVKAHDAVLVGPINKVYEAMGGKPEVVERSVECLVDILIIFQDVLEEHGGFADASGAFDANHPGLPIDLVIEIPLEPQVNSGNLAVIVFNKRP